MDWQSETCQNRFLSDIVNLLIHISCPILTLILIFFCLRPQFDNGVLVRNLYGIREALQCCEMEKNVDRRRNKYLGKRKRQ